MKISTLTYNFKQGLINIWRNKMFSLASIATMTACIFLFGVFYALGMNFGSMVQSAEEGVAVTVFFEEGISEEQIETIGNEISTRPEVANYNFVSAEEAWESFKEYYFEGNEEAAAGFEDDNPMANSANYEVFLNDVSQQDNLVEFLEGLEGVREVKQSEMAADVLTDFNNLIALIFVAIIVILIAVAVFLISNTVTVGISVRREEIAIMKLIGAKDTFVRAPFIVEGIVIGLIGSVIPLGLLYALYGNIVRYVSEKFSMLSSLMEFVPVKELFRVLLPVSLILGVGIGFIGSRFTLKRHLKV
ncbi:MAG: permease-like cell division protein FtsX [Lachnospiraceae bacterium]|nr:permease-like cell division protein FtsX [Lachnospiraceae bacterium]